MGGLFKTALFGYNKKGVTAYIEQICKTFDQKAQEYERQIALLKEENSKAERQMRELEAQKELIAGALVDAQEKAREVIAQAQEQAAKEMEAVQRRISAENERLSAVRREISAVRRSALDTVDRLTKDLEDLVEERV